MGSLTTMPISQYPNDFYPMLKLKTAHKQIPSCLKRHNGFRCSMLDMGSLKAVVQHPNEMYPLLKMNMEMKMVEKHTPTLSHWGFCYSILRKVSTTFVLVIQQLSTAELRDAACIFYLLLRALDTVEDDTNIPNEIKVPILKDFHHHIYDRDFHFACGTKEKKVLMDNFHHVSTAFLELNESYQEVIGDTIMKMGAGMAKFICKECETIEDYDEYCYVAGSLTTLGFTNLFHASGTEISFPENLVVSIGLFPQKSDVVKDFLEDINLTPTPRRLWPREIWSKFVDNPEELQYEENSEKALQCLNEMVENSLMHVDDCLKCLSMFRDQANFRFMAIMEVIAMGELAFCYNNIQVFRGDANMRRGLMAQVFVNTKTMADVYGAFYDFSSILKSKIDMNDPNAKRMISKIEAVQRTCMDSGTLDKWKSYVVESEKSKNRTTLIGLFSITMAILSAYLSLN